MWIIPKNLKTKNSHIYHYAQDTEALTLDYSELSEMCEQSLLWRSKPSRSATWLRRWKTDLLSQHLFGRILKPSLGKCLMEKWISCQVASLVNHSVRQVEEKGTKTQGTSSPTSRKEYENVDLPLFSWKMLKESCQANSKDKTGQILNTHRFCYTSSESWKDWVTKQRRDYSQRARQVHHINANECSFLVSVMNSPNQALIMSPNLSQEASQEEQLTQLQEEENSIGMNRQGLRWATPTTRDFLGWYSRHCQEDPTKKTRSLLPDQAHSGTYQGKLNPRWVEMLMGLPIGWTMPTCLNPMKIELMNSGCLETEFCPTQQEQPSLQCGKNFPTPNTRDWKDTLNTVPPSINKTRGYSLGQAIAEDIKNDTKRVNQLATKTEALWKTPQANDYKQTTLSVKALKHRKKQGSQFMLATEVHEIEQLKQGLLLVEICDT